MAAADPTVRKTVQKFFDLLIVKADSIDDLWNED